MILGLNNVTQEKMLVLLQNNNVYKEKENINLVLYWD